MAHFKCLTIFFPMLNEEDYIESCVKVAREAGQRLINAGEIETYEILIINDGSTDRTAAIADQMALSDDKVRVIHHERRRGLGAGLKTGFTSGRGDLLFYSDADLPFDLFELEKACRLMRLYDAHIVGAYRYSRLWEGPKRFIYSTIYNHLIRALFSIKLRDVNTPFKLCRSSIFEKISLKSEGSFIDAELIIEAQRNGFRLIEFGLDYFPRTRGVSTLSSVSVMRKIVHDLYQYKMGKGPYKKV